MLRALQLLIIDLYAVGHRLRHDLGKELAALVASLILLATFIYVFDDFLNVQIAEVSQAIRNGIARAAGFSLLLGGILGATRAIARDYRNPSSCRNMAKSLGEHPSVIAWYDLGRGLAIICLWALPTWFITNKFFFVLGSTALNISLLFLLLLSTGVSGCLARRHRADRPSTIQIAKIRRQYPKYESTLAKALLAWRFTLHITRNHTNLSIYGIASIIVICGGVTYTQGAPFLAPIIAALIAGMLISFILALALAADLEHAWIEHALGVAHNDIIACYVQLARRLAIPLALLLLLICLAASPHEWTSAWKPAAILLVTPLFTPYILFQIDARRPGINILSIIIVGLFLGTAIFAHGLAIILPLIAKTSLADNQANRFHRA